MSAPQEPHPSLPTTAPAPSPADVAKAFETLYAAGLQTRTSTTSPEHVARSLSAASDFSAPMQHYVTTACWGSIWTRPGLAPGQRSLLNVVMLAALGRSKELAVHVRGALRNGISVQELQEALLQVACYCGMPAGMEGFRVADEVVQAVIKEREAEAGEGGK